MRLRVQAFPNRELRVSFLPEAPLRRSQPEVIPTSGFVCEGEGPSCQEQEGSFPVIGGLVGGCSSSTLPLASNSKPSSPLPRPGYGGLPSPTQFGNRARRTLLRAGGAIESSGIPPHELVFLTGTLPGSSSESFRALQCWSSYAVNLLKSKISKLGISHSLSLYVWELQKRGALHIHYCVHVPCPVLRQLLIDRFQKMWIQILDCIGEKAGVDMFSRGDLGGSWSDRKEVVKAFAQEVRKGVGQYMAKYLSKDSNRGSGACSGSPDFLGPVRWWGVSRPLLSLLDQLTDTIDLSGISVYRIRHIREEILHLLDGLDSKIQRYCDLAKRCEILIGYGEDFVYVFDQIFRYVKPRVLFVPPYLQLGSCSVHAVAGELGRDVAVVPASVPKDGPEQLSLFGYFGRMRRQPFPGEDGDAGDGFVRGLSPVPLL